MDGCQEWFCLLFCFLLWRMKHLRRLQNHITVLGNALNQRASELNELPDLKVLITRSYVAKLCAFYQSLSTYHGHFAVVYVPGISFIFFFSFFLSVYPLFFSLFFLFSNSYLSFSFWLVFFSTATYFFPFYSLKTLSYILFHLSFFIYRLFLPSYFIGSSTISPHFYHVFFLTFHLSCLFSVF